MGFERGDRVRFAGTFDDPEEQLEWDPADIGTVLIPEDPNGDAHVEFDMAGIGIYRPTEIQLLDPPERVALPPERFPF